MYEHQGLQDICFIMLYGGATMSAIMACLYLLLARGNAFSLAIKAPTELRQWAAAFMATVAASHVWWVVLGIYWLVDDRLIRNIVAITLDRVTFVPLMMCVLVRMLQDRHRKLWPIAVAMVPFLVTAVVSMVTRSDAFEWYVEGYSLLLGITFLIYYIRALRQYERWLHDNYADLQHKEVWQSLVLLSCILLVYMAYTTNEGALATEYLAQVLTLVIIAFVVWRVETLQTLDVGSSVESPTVSPINIGALLKDYCEATQLYLRHDINLQQLAIIIGTNRTYLSNYFAQQGITYNAYINRLRIDHFMHLYRDAAADSRPVTAMKLSQQSGFSNYNTFAAAFKRFVGTTVTEWVQQENAKEKIIEKT